MTSDEQHAIGTAMYEAATALLDEYERRLASGEDKETLQREIMLRMPALPKKE